MSAAQEPRTWCITGASSGLGQALAVAASARGDRVAALVRRPEAAAALEALGSGRIRAVLADMADRSTLAAAVQAAETAVGPIDILVNNAGQVLETTVEEADPAAIEQIFAVNVFAPVAMIRAVLPSMRARHTGRIVNISSGGGFVGLPALGVYSATKFALEGLSEGLAGEVGPLGIHVTIVEPGSFRTNLLAGNTRTIASAIDDYETTCGAWRRQLAAMSGRERNDPVLFAQAMLALIDHPQPPLRLPLGDDAIGMVDGKLAAVARDIAPWRSVGQGLDCRD